MNKPKAGCCQVASFAGRRANNQEFRTDYGFRPFRRIKNRWKGMADGADVKDPFCKSTGMPANICLSKFDSPLNNENIATSSGIGLFIKWILHSL